jgi:mono/diheme cytochrome c family protein
MIALVLASSGLGIAVAQTTTAPPKPNETQGPPQYQMRAPEGMQSRVGHQQDGASVFSYHCGYCHLSFGMGTNLLTKQQVIAGNPPAMGLLTNRTDLQADYVKAVVRQGKGAMPPQTRVDITDAELATVSAYLSKGKAQ